MKATIVTIALLASAAVASAAQRETVFCLDGARYRIEATAVRGVAEVALPAGMQAESLRVRPLGAATISRVDLSPPRPDPKAVREKERLFERKELLQDRLKALETREEIFRTAAKTQSGKAPRKTKANPEPMATIRQGTEYAIAQLEEVYRLRRRTEKEIAALDARLAALRTGTAAGGGTVRVWLDAPRGRVAVSCAVPGAGWKPRYEIRCDGGGSALVTLRAVLPKGASGPASVVAAALNDAAAEAAHPVSGDAAVVESFRLPVSAQQVVTSPRTSLQVSVTNRTGRPLPAGDADGYWKGEYLGNIPVSATSPDGTADLRFGGARQERP